MISGHISNMAYLKEPIASIPEWVHFFYKLLFLELTALIKEIVCNEIEKVSTRQNVKFRIEDTHKKSSKIFDIFFHPE